MPTKPAAETKATVTETESSVVVDPSTDASALADILETAAPIAVATEPVVAPPDSEAECTATTVLPPSPHLSELELAQRFAVRASEEFRWSPGMGWMCNMGTHWERDDHLKRLEVAKLVCRSAATEVSGKTKVNDAKKLCSRATVSSMLSMAQSEAGIVTPTADWNAHPMLLNTLGEVFDLTTGLPVSRTGLLFTQVAGVAPADMPTPVWDKFLSEVFNNDVEIVEFIQRLAGYCLTGSIQEQKLFFLYGAGANGKSVLLEVLRAIGGKYSHNLPSEALMASKNERHPTTIAALHGKRLAISSEIEASSHWAESHIKTLTGDETQTARYMRCDEFTFATTHKHVIAGNFKPRIKGGDPAMERRMVLIPFNQKFTGERRDNLLPAKLKAEYPGILKWAIEGARKWATGGLLIPSAIAESSRQYMLEQDDIHAWVTECCEVVSTDVRSKSSELYTSYAEWKQANGEVAGSSKNFSQMLELKFQKHRTSSGMFFCGLQLKTRLYQPNPYEIISRGH